MCGEHLSCGGMSGLIGGDDMHTAGATGKIPVLTATDVLGKRTVVIVSNYVDVRDISVYHAGKTEVNESVSARKRNSGNGSVACKSGKRIVIQT